MFLRTSFAFSFLAHDVAVHFFDDLFCVERLLQGLLARSPGDLSLEISEAQAPHGHHVPSHTGDTLGPINDDALLVDNVDDGAQLPLARPVRDKSKAAGLNEAVEHCEVEMGDANYSIINL